MDPDEVLYTLFTVVSCPIIQTHPLSLIRAVPFIARGTEGVTNMFRMPTRLADSIWTIAPVPLSLLTGDSAVRLKVERDTPVTGFPGPVAYTDPLTGGTTDGPPWFRGTGCSAVFTIISSFTISAVWTHKVTFTNHHTGDITHFSP